MKKLVVVADVSTGYGSPIIPKLSKSLAKHYGSQAIVIEPDQPECPPLHFEDLEVRRIPARQHPHSTHFGHYEFIDHAAQAIDEIDPDVLVVCCAYNLPLLVRLKKRPPTVIYYAIELTECYGSMPSAVLHYKKDLIDLVIYPEAYRAERETAMFDLDCPSTIVLNSVNESFVDESSLQKKKGSILYSGLIDTQQTCLDLWLETDCSGFTVDFYGKPSGLNSAETKTALETLKPPLFYKGFVSNDQLKEIRKEYAWSFVAWRPLDFNHLYAAPNKFFESLAGLVPPIVAPHPQCKDIVTRFGCGIVMKDWTAEALNEALAQAREIESSPQDYARMVEGCKNAVTQECNWTTQFRRVATML